jgi:hypothetical protein
MLSNLLTVFTEKNVSLKRRKQMSTLMRAMLGAAFFAVFVMPSQADFVVTVSEAGVGSFTITQTTSGSTAPTVTSNSAGATIAGLTQNLAGNGFSFQALIGDYSITAQTATSNAPGTSVVGLIDLDTSALTETPTTANPMPLVMTLTTTTPGNTLPTWSEFTAPPAGPGAEKSALTGTLITGSGTPSLSEQNYLGTPVAGPPPSGPVTYTPEGSALTALNTSQTTGVTLTTPYFLQLTLAVSFSGNSGTIDSLDANEQVITGDAPAGLMLAFAALPILAIGGWVSRRRAIAATA